MNFYLERVVKVGSTRKPAVNPGKQSRNLRIYSKIFFLNIIEDSFLFDYIQRLKTFRLYSKFFS